MRKERHVKVWGKHAKQKAQQTHGDRTKWVCVKAQILVHCGQRERVKRGWREPMLER